MNMKNFLYAALFFFLGILFFVACSANNVTTDCKQTEEGQTERHNIDEQIIKDEKNLDNTEYFTVYYDSKGGTGVEPQYVKSGTILKEPSTEKAGYDFLAWSYDFSLPVVGDTYIAATWRACDNTPYKTEYWLENADNDEYNLTETVYSVGTTDTQIDPDIKRFENFFFDSFVCCSGDNIYDYAFIGGDGNSTIRIYYKRKKFIIRYEVYPTGATIFSSVYKFGQQAKIELDYEYLLCNDYLWFIGNEKVSDEENLFNFTVACDCVYILKVSLKNGLEDFNIKSTSNTCEIYDCGRNLSEITIPDCVTYIGENTFSLCDDLSYIYYSGTIANWNLITGDRDLGLKVDCVIRCSDGDVVTQSRTPSVDLLPLYRVFCNCQ